MKRPLIAVVIIMMLATPACSININIPRLETGPTQTFTFNEPLSNGNDGVTQINLEMGAGTLNLSSGAEGLAEGTVKYNISQWTPKVDRSSSGELTLRQAQANVNSIPTGNIVNDWKVKLSSNTPLDLAIKTGADIGTLDMSKLRLHSLSITDGASKTQVTFDSPNPVKMDSLSYTTGASQVELRGLANANFTSMTFESGAGDYTLDFSGKLSQDTSVDIKSGLSNMTIIIPLDTNVKVVNLGAISNISMEGTWTVNGSTYTAGSQGYLLTIHVKMSIGNLKLVRR